MTEDITLKLTKGQARALYRLIYNHGHWQSESLFPVENSLIDQLGIDAQTQEDSRTEKDQGVGKLFTLYRKGGPQVLAEVLGLGTPEAINMSSLVWQDLEAILYYVSVGRRTSRRNDQTERRNDVRQD